MSNNDQSSTASTRDVATFGACVNTGGFVRCAASPSGCQINAGESYMPSSLTEPEAFCGVASAVQVGRCSADADDGRCALSPDVCVDPSRFVNVTAGEDSCTIVGDLSEGAVGVVDDEDGDAVGSATLYGSCVRTDANEFQDPNDVVSARCVAYSSECEEGEIFERFVAGKPCRCDDVKTGVCVRAGDALITRDNSHCAVSAADCVPKYVFKTAAEVERLGSWGDDYRDCRLCRHSDQDVEENVPHDLPVVESGACAAEADDGTYDPLFCALESFDCAESGLEFLTATELRDIGGVPCPAREMPGGRCDSSFSCVGTDGACANPATFVKGHQCHLHSDLKTGDATIFGMCRQNEQAGGDWNAFRCVWDASECDTGVESTGPFETYRPAVGPDHWTGESCNCEMVGTGACREPDGTQFCAVSEAACSNPAQYVKSYELEGDEKCMLCHPDRPNPVPVPVPVPGPPGPAPASPTRSPTSPSKRPTPGPPGPIPVDDSERKENEAVAAVVVLGLAAALVVVVLLNMFRRRSRNRRVERASATKRDLDLDVDEEDVSSSTPPPDDAFFQQEQQNDADLVPAEGHVFT